jgi:uncharacterized protein
MKAREFDPRRLDVQAFAEASGQLDGAQALADWPRLAESAAAATAQDELGPVRWTLRGESRPARGGPPQTWLHLQAGAQIDLECQRCLQPVRVALNAQRSFLFVAGEDTAAALDADSEDDVLALTRALDVPALVEDELLLSLPLVPKHEHCPSAPALASSDDTLAEPAPHPFAGLAALKGRVRPH